jgi:glycosyltransferase involved in cell wall biosynthesis
MGDRKAIKVIYIINHSDLYGANKALLNLLDLIVYYGVSPKIIMGKKGDICEELDQRDIPYEIVSHQFSIYPQVSRKRLISYVSFLPKLLLLFYHNFKAATTIVKIAQEYNADLIHTNIGPDHVGYLAARIMGIPHVWHIREYQDLHFKWHSIPSKTGFIRKLNSANNYPIAITYGLYKHYKIQKSGLVIYDGVMKKMHTKFVASKKKYFLFAGRLEEAKGIRQAIEGFIEFAKNNIDYEFLLAGSGGSAFVEDLHKIAQDSGFSQRIHFLGFRCDVYDLMARATALIVSSLNEGFGFITAEAMFNGCLVIGNNSGGTKEILENENFGILYTGHDALVSAMKMVVTKGIESYFHMIRKAQERAIVLYSVEHNVSAVYNLYQEISSNRQNNA